MTSVKELGQLIRDNAKVPDLGHMEIKRISCSINGCNDNPKYIILSVDHNGIDDYFLLCITHRMELIEVDQFVCNG